MKKLFIVLVLAACTKSDVTLVGCQSGISSRGFREIYRCATEQQFHAGWNVQAGGTELYQYFTNNAWCPCNCQPLKQLQDTDQLGCLTNADQFIECCFKSQASMEINRMKLTSAKWTECADCHK